MKDLLKFYWPIIGIGAGIGLTIGWAAFSSHKAPEMTRAERMKAFEYAATWGCLQGVLLSIQYVSDDRQLITLGNRAESDCVTLGKNYREFIEAGNK